MRRIITATALQLVTFALLAPVALADRVDNGEGTYGPANDKVVTNTGFLLMIFFPLLITLISLLQWRLEKRKDARKAAKKARLARGQLGW